MVRDARLRSSSYAGPLTMRVEDYAAFHSCMPSAALLITPAAPTAERSRSSSRASVALSLGRDARERALVVLVAQDDDAVLGSAIAIVDHRKTFDLCLAGRVGIEFWGLPRFLSAVACTLTLSGSGSAGAFGDSTSAWCLVTKPPWP